MHGARGRIRPRAQSLVGAEHHHVQADLAMTGRTESVPALGIWASRCTVAAKQARTASVAGGGGSGPAGPVAGSAGSAAIA
jgi:hypothetical protein